MGYIDDDIITFAIEVGKRKSEIEIAAVIAEKTGLTETEITNRLNRLVENGKIYISGSGARNVFEDPSGSSNPMIWYGEWPEGPSLTAAGRS